MENVIYDCIVVGGGPGGLVSALYLGRFRRNVLLIDGGQSRARWIPKIRNLIGYAQGLTGPQLLKRLRKQVQQYPVAFKTGEAHIRRAKKGFEVKVDKQKYLAKTVILATGIIDTQPALDNISYLRGLGLLGYCPICDGYDHAENKVALIVKNNSCFRKIRFISALCPQLVIIPVKKLKFTTSVLKMAEKGNIEIAPSNLKKIDYHQPTRKLLIHLEETKKPVKVDFAYVALGVEFDKSAVQHLKGLRRTREGFIQTASHQETSIPGLYAVGDCVNALAQVSVAIGQAALAATRIHQSLF